MTNIELPSFSGYNTEITRSSQGVVMLIQEQPALQGADELVDIVTLGTMTQEKFDALVKFLCELQS